MSGGAAWSAAFLLINGWMSVAIFIITMVPMRSGGFFSDGARLLRFTRGGEAAELDALLMQIVASSTSGTRPRELDEAVLDRGLEVGERLGSPFSETTGSKAWKLKPLAQVLPIP